MLVGFVAALFSRTALHLWPPALSDLTSLYADVPDLHPDRRSRHGSRSEVLNAISCRPLMTMGCRNL